MSLRALKSLYQSDIRKLQLCKDKKDFEKLDRKFLKLLSKECENLGLFETRNKNGKTPFEQFWENYLALYLVDNDIDLKKDMRDGAPDYYFVANGKKIHIEAKAPNDATKPEFQTHKNPEIGVSKNNNFSFEDGYIQPNNAILRFIYIIKETRKKQIEGTFLDSGALERDDYIILAINGHQVVKNTEFLPYVSVNNPNCLASHIKCSLFGFNGDQSLIFPERKIIWNQGEPIKGVNPIDNSFFCSGNKTPIMGILYSNVFFNAGVHSEEFVFIPNPEKEDLSTYFPFCPSLHI